MVNVSDTRRLPRITRPLLCAAGLLAASLARLPSGSAGRDASNDRQAVKLTSFDEAAVPGAQVTLRAKLDHPLLWGVHFNLKGQPLRFSSPSLVSREVKTSEDGVAT